LIRFTHPAELQAFNTWLASERPGLLPKSEIAGAFTYPLNQWEALLRYTEDGFFRH
jgi:hypothetical protein